MALLPSVCSSGYFAQVLVVVVDIFYLGAWGGGGPDWFRWLAFKEVEYTYERQWLDSMYPYAYAIMGENRIYCIPSGGVLIAQEGIGRAANLGRFCGGCTRRDCR